MHTKTETYLLAIARYGLLLYLFLMFLDKAMTLRELGLYGAFAAWLALTVMGSLRPPTLNPITLAMGAFAASVLLSTALSIDPGYSVWVLKKDFTRALVLFLILSGAFRSLDLIERAGMALGAAGVILLALGAHGLAAGPTGVYTPESAFMALDKNTFGFAIGIIFPFYVYFFLTAFNNRTLWAALCLWSFIALFLSASRASVLAAIAALIVWGMHLKGTAGARAIRMTAASVLIVIVLAAASFPLWPPAIKEHFRSTGEHITTFNMRTYYFWKPALEAAQKHPVAGWGFGDKIWRDPRPFEGTEKPYTELTGGLHSTFIGTLFQQGALGLLAYLFLTGAIICVLYRIRRTSHNTRRRAMAVCLMGVAIGVMLVQATFKLNSIRSMALIAGLAVALLGTPQSNHGDER